MGPCVPILSISHWVHAESLPLVVQKTLSRWDSPIHHSANTSLNRDSEEFTSRWRMHFFLSLKIDRKTGHHTHCSFLQLPYRYPSWFSLGGFWQGIARSQLLFFFLFLLLWSPVVVWVMTVVALRSYSTCVLERNPWWTRRGRPSFGKATGRPGDLIQETPLRSPAVPVSLPNDISSDITMLWLLHVKHVKLFAARRDRKLQYSMWTIQTGLSWLTCDGLE